MTTIAERTNELCARCFAAGIGKAELLTMKPARTYELLGQWGFSDEEIPDMFLELGRRAALEAKALRGYRGNHGHA